MLRLIPSVEPGSKYIAEPVPDAPFLMNLQLMTMAVTKSLEDALALPRKSSPPPFAKEGLNESLVGLKKGLVMAELSANEEPAMYAENFRKNKAPPPM